MFKRLLSIISIQINPCKLNTLLKKLDFEIPMFLRITNYFQTILFLFLYSLSKIFIFWTVLILLHVFINSFGFHFKLFQFVQLFQVIFADMINDSQTEKECMSLMRNQQRLFTDHKELLLYTFRCFFQRNLGR